MISWEVLVPERIEPERLGVLIVGGGEAVLFERAHGNDIERVLEIRRRWRPNAGRLERARRARSFTRIVTQQLDEIAPRLSGLVLLAESELLGRIRWALPDTLTRRVRLSLIRPPKPVEDDEVSDLLLRYTALLYPESTQRILARDPPGYAARTESISRNY